MKIIMTGGGTGGHVNPALAIASAFPNDEIFFVGARRGLENKLVPNAGYKLYTVSAEGLSRKITLEGVIHNIKAIKNNFIALQESKKIIKEIMPDIVIGTGGYASYSTIKSAQKMGIKTAILEVNALAGITTKMLAKKCDKVFISFESTRKDTCENAILSGAPVRQEIIFAKKDIARKKIGIAEGEKLVVSFWGSLGAKYMNENILNFMKKNEKNKNFRHVHASGSTGYKELKEKTKGFENTEVLEYIYDMPNFLAAADVVLCRAGAATLSEISALGKACVIVPSPYVTDNHQEKNAKEFEKKGAGIVVLEKNSLEMYDSVMKILDDDDMQKNMEKAAFKLSKIDALEIIRKEILSIV